MSVEVGREPAHSPRITHVSWGRLEIDDGRTFKDAKLFPGGARDWDWSETGTHHVPGIQPGDVLELLERGATAIVLSRGIEERLQVRFDTIDFLRNRGVDVHIAQTEAAVRIYNALQISERVGGLFHSTC